MILVISFLLHGKTFVQSCHQCRSTVSDIESERVMKSRGSEVSLMPAVSTGSHDQATFTAAVQNTLRCVCHAKRNGSDQAERVLGFNRKHLNKKVSGCTLTSNAEKEHK